MYDFRVRTTYDPVADAAFVYLRGEIPGGAVVKSRLVPVAAKGTSMIIAYDESGNALGVEFLGCSKLFTPEMIEALSKGDRP